jgi:hypothetical protein
MCAADLGARHRHVVALDDRAIRCVCRPCGLLFAPAGAGAGRIRAVPERYLTDQSRRIADADWEVLSIPVLPVFLFVNSDLDRVVACYPSPAGATESLLNLDGWTGLLEAYPLLRMPVADVEAVYVTRTDAGLEAFVVPIDACFEMVGRVRSSWRGPYGGDTVRRTMATFLQELRDRSRPLRGTEASLRRGTSAR